MKSQAVCFHEYDMEINFPPRLVGLFQKGRPDLGTGLKVMGLPIMHQSKWGHHS